MTNTFTQLKKTVITFPLLVQDSGSSVLENLGVSLSAESKIQDAEISLSHIDVSTIAHIEPCRDNPNTCWVTIFGLNFLVRLTHEQILLVINSCMLKHGSMDVPFALFNATDVIKELQRK